MIQVFWKLLPILLNDSIDLFVRLSVIRRKMFIYERPYVPLGVKGIDDVM